MAKILIFSHEFPPVQGGAGSVAESIANGLSESHDVTVVTRAINRSVHFKKFRLKEIKLFPLIFPLFYWRFLKKEFKTNNPDKIIINDIGAAITAAFFFSDNQKAKTYMFFHGNEYEAILSKSSLKKKILSHFYNKLINKCHALIFVSGFLKEKILLHLEERSGEKSKILYNSIDTKLFSSVEKNKVKSTINILTVCRVVEQKGLDNIVQILVKLKESKIDFEWKLIGSGYYLEHVKKQMSFLGLADHFVHIPHVSRDQLKFHYQKASLFLLLSEFEESFGLVYLEANACGIPVIGKNKGGVKEAIVNGISGFIVEDKTVAFEIIYKRTFDMIKQEDCIKHAAGFDSISYNTNLTKILLDL
ncbi:glycosyltransferase family 4 protein [Pedobacter arcticus]|uniref:glycosyltransferase family 4 protein n=1 Tax=Pedobacter arcticus TaxID=752140 RepID=UPI0003783110|nr:glycosyltransferase family 4 protein [Pedobacter arcticus]